jgi:hypothetical protein
MKIMILVLAGTMSVATAFGHDPAFEQRFNMKTGRHTPAEEARRNQASLAAKPAMTMCCDHQCCDDADVAAPKSAAALGDARTTEQNKAALPALVAEASTCERGCCAH